MIPLTVGSIRRLESAEGIPDGIYEGSWSGFRVGFVTHHGEFELKVNVCYMGIASVSVTISCGRAIVVFPSEESSNRK